MEAFGASCVAYEVACCGADRCGGCTGCRGLKWLADPTVVVALPVIVVAATCSTCQKWDGCGWRQSEECARRMSNE